MFSQIVVGGCLSITLLLATTQATPKYTMDQRRLSDGRTDVHLYDRSTRRTVWMQAAHRIDLVRWSADHRAIAVLDDDDTKSANWFRLLVWREGDRLRVYTKLPPFETVKDIAWSPDKSHLLLLGPRSQGEGDAGFGHLWCLRVGAASARLLDAGPVTRAQWVSPTRIRYWVGKYVKATPDATELTLKETPREKQCR